MQHDFPPIAFIYLIVRPTAHTEQKRVEGRKDNKSWKKEKKKKEGLRAEKERKKLNSVAFSP
jgi:hypothetical protein